MKRVHAALAARMADPAMALRRVSDAELQRLINSLFLGLDTTRPEYEARLWFDLAMAEAAQRKLAPPRNVVWRRNASQRLSIGGRCDAFPTTPRGMLRAIAGATMMQVQAPGRRLRGGRRGRI